MDGTSAKCVMMALLKIAALISVMVSAVIFLFAGSGVAEQTTEHPFIEAKEIKSETCLTCHPDKKEGKFVHTAVGMGCENCHQATSENGKTTISPIAAGGELCAMCHEAKTEAAVHGPYQNGLCIVCHDPHSSDFPKQVRAETNTLCMSCHGVNQPDVKVQAAIKTVSLLGGKTLDLGFYRQATKIGLDRSGKTGHPLVRHPFSGANPLKKGSTISCLSCHVPHTSPAPHLLPVGAKSDLDLCGQCHE